MTDRPITPTLDLVNLPADVKRLSDRQLRNLADELRAETISAVSVTGGHLGAGLGGLGGLGPGLGAGLVSDLPGWPKTVFADPPTASAAKHRTAMGAATRLLMPELQMT